MSRYVTNLFIVFCVVVFTLSVLPVLASSPAVHIPDANLRAAINAALGEGRAADAVVTRSELASLTTLSFQTRGLAIGEQVTDLTGLEYATSLTRLELGFNAITDLGPLATLTALTYLDLRRNTGITSVSALSRLVNLTYLNLWQCRVSDMSPLQYMIRLEQLWFRGNGASDISALANLTALQQVHLSENGITDISPLVRNTGIGAGDTVVLASNPLTASSARTTDIPALEARGARVFVVYPSTFLLPEYKTFINDPEPRSRIQETFFLDIFLIFVNNGRIQSEIFKRTEEIIMIREILSNRAIQCAVVFIVVVVVGSLLYLQHVEREHAEPTHPIQEATAAHPHAHDAAVHPHSHDAQHDDDIHRYSLHAGETRTPPHEFSPKDWDALDNFRAHIFGEGVESGAISLEEGEYLLSREEMRLATQGMSSFEALQYIYNSPSLRPPAGYLKELAEQALLENPEDPEVLYHWAILQHYVKEGPNPESEAAFQKILAMDNLPAEHRRKTLDGFAGTVWYYKPEDAVRYIAESRALSEKDSLYDIQGNAYERLGQYEKAMEVYRDYHAQTGDWFAWRHIQAIEAGTPLIEPIERPVSEMPLAGDTVSDTDTYPEASDDDASFVDEFDAVDEFNVPQPLSLDDAALAREAQRAAEADARRMAEQEAAFRQFMREEFPEYAELLDGDFGLDEGAEVEGLGSLESVGALGADSPEIEEERIRAAWQLLQQHGPETALRRLRATDPVLAREIEKQLSRAQREKAEDSAHPPNSGGSTQ